MVEILVLDLFGVGGAFVDTGIGHADLAHFVHLAIADLTIGVIEDPDVGIGKRDPDRTDLLFTRHRVARHKTGRLGQPVAFDDGHAGRLLKPVEQFQRQRR